MGQERKCAVPSIAGAILAGGRASRLGGRPKGLLLRSDSRSIIQHQIEELRAAGIDDIVISAKEPETYSGFGVDIIADPIEGIGPLGGIHAALTRFAGKFDGTMIIPCDLPNISRREITLMMEAFQPSDLCVVVASTGSFFVEPLCMVIHNGLADRLLSAINRGVRKPRLVWLETGTRIVRFDDVEPFMNVNTPEDLARWRGSAPSGPVTPDKTGS